MHNIFMINIKESLNENKNLQFQNLEENSLISFIFLTTEDVVKMNDYICDLKKDLNLIQIDDHTIASKILSFWNSNPIYKDLYNNLYNNYLKTHPDYSQKLSTTENEMLEKNKILETLDISKNEQETEEKLKILKQITVSQDHYENTLLKPIIERIHNVEKKISFLTNKKK